MLYRRSRSLVCYWQRDRLVLANYATGKSITANPVVCAVLDVFDRWRPARALDRRFLQFSPASLRRTLGELSRHTLLQRSDRLISPRERALEGWTGWNPAAAFFHFSTKDFPYAADDPATALRWLRQHARETPPPASVKRYRSARQIPLPPPATQGEFPQVLLARRTWRRFSRRAIEQSALATLLGLTFGVQRWVELRGVGRLALKTSPSGGARHPIEAYVLVLRGKGLAAGLYHYASDLHRLERLRPGVGQLTLTKLLAEQWWFGDAAAVVLMTAVLPRVQWKYPFARAYRTVLAEAGHFCQTFYLVATWLGLAPFCTMAFKDSHIERLLGVDGVSETVLYVAGVGTRPAGEAWTPWLRPRR